MKTDPTEPITVRTANGGFVGHWCPDGSFTSACGFAPSSPNGHLIRGRGYWKRKQTAAAGIFVHGETRMCPKCEAKLRKAFDFESL